MAKEESGLLPVTDENSAVVLYRENLVEAMRESLNEIGTDLNTWDFVRARMPSGSGGGKDWNVTVADTVQKHETITGVVIHTYRTRSYWKTKLSPANTVPPDCSSQDTLIGIGDNGSGKGSHDCLDCPQNLWGSAGEGSQAKACRERINLYILQEKELFPVHVALPAGSLRPWRQYIQQAVMNDGGMRPYQVVSELRLDDSQGYSTVRPRLVRKLGAVEVTSIEKYRETVVAAAERDAKMMAQRRINEISEGEEG